MNQRAAGLRGNLNLAGALKVVHEQERGGNIFADHQQAVVAQHQVVGFAQISLQAWLFFVTQGDAFVGVVRQGAQHKGGLLADGQHAALLGADRHARPGVGVQHATGIFTRLVNTAVNDKARRVDGERRVVELVAILVNLDQAGGGDLVKRQPIGVD